MIATGIINSYAMMEDKRYDEEPGLDSIQDEE